MPRKQATVKPIKLDALQKEEIRRLTQQANRRIKAANKLYESKGLSVAPYEVTGGIQEKSQWQSEKYALSRTTKFKTMKDYKEHLAFLKSFDKGKQSRPTIVQYADIQRKKTKMAIETMVDGPGTEKLDNILKDMDSADLSKFWKRYSELASRLGLEYSSSAMISYAQEYFKEDIVSLVEVEI